MIEQPRRARRPRRKKKHLTVLALALVFCSLVSAKESLLVLVDVSLDGKRGPESEIARVSVFVRALLEPAWAESQDVSAIASDRDDVEDTAWIGELFERGSLSRGKTLDADVSSKFPGLERVGGVGGVGGIVLRLSSGADAGGSGGVEVRAAEIGTTAKVRAACSYSADPSAARATPSRIHNPSELYLPADLEAVAEAVAGLRETSLEALDVKIAALEAERLAGDEVARGAAGRAESAARALVIRYPENAAATRILAQCLEASGEFERALERWRQAVAKAPNSAFLRYGVAMAYEKTDRPVEASLELERLLDLTGDAPDEDLSRRARAALERLRTARRVEESRRAAWDDARAEVTSRREARQRQRDSRSAESRRRLEQARRRIDDDPKSPAARLELGEALLEDGLLTAASRAFEEAMRRSDSSAAREGLARTYFQRGKFAEATRLLRESEIVLDDAPSRILLGDCLLAQTQSGWKVERWSEYAESLGSLDVRSYLRVRGPPETAETEVRAAQRAIWEEAGEHYRAAVDLTATRSGADRPEGTRTELESRALARLADWVLLEARGFDESLDASWRPGDFRTDEPYPDLYRVEACRLHLVGKLDESRLAMDRFLERRALAPNDVVRVAGRFQVAASQVTDPSVRQAYLERAIRRVNLALERWPGHPALRRLRGTIHALEGRPGEAAADLRYALAAGDRSWEALRKAWQNPPLGPRSGRPPITAPLAVTDDGGGAPRNLFEFLELRGELCRVLLATGEPLQALAEIRPLEGFLAKEERRLKGTRGRRERAIESTASREWTQLDSRRAEPVDFGNDRERSRWAWLRVLEGHCERHLGRRDSARRRYAWAARCLAVRDGVVLAESRWEAEIAGRSLRVLTEALTGLAELYADQGRVEDSRAIFAWIERLRAPSAKDRKRHPELDR